MGSGKVGGDGYGLPAEKNKKPEHEVNKDGGKDEDTDVDASLQPAYGKSRAYVTCKHGGLL
jgi:hypothetical protein